MLVCSVVLLWLNADRLRTRHILSETWTVCEVALKQLADTGF